MKKKRIELLAMRLRLLLLLVLSFCASHLFGQTASADPRANGEKKVYIKLGMSVGPASFRDRATSPLFYYGAPLGVFLSRYKVRDHLETEFGIRLIGGRYSASVNEVSVGSSFFGSMTLGYTRLYEIKRWANEKWDFKGGGTIAATANLRGNEGLQNNALGFESFHNLMGSMKVVRDVSRMEEKHKSIWFIDYTLQPRERALSYQLDIGLVNSYFRNGYAYIDHWGVVNEGKYLQEYQLHVSGLRFGAELAYTIHLLNAKNNAIQIAYKWDAVQTEPGADAFAMAFHVIRFSLLYNTK